MDRIKGLRQKKPDNSFAALVPFGTDGLLVDMLSGLDNEQELKLGGNHSSVITEVDENTTTVVETYKELDNTTETYKVETSVVENQDGSTTVTSVLKKAGVVLRTKTITIPADAASITIGEVVS